MLNMHNMYYYRPGQVFTCDTMFLKEPKKFQLFPNVAFGAPIFLPGFKCEISEGFSIFADQLSTCGFIAKKSLSEDLEVEVEAANTKQNQLNAKIHSKYGGTNYLRLDFDWERRCLRKYCLSLIAPSQRFGGLIKAYCGDA